MTFSIAGLAVARGISIGRAVLVGASRVGGGALFHRAGADRERDRPRALWPQCGGRGNSAFAGRHSRRCPQEPTALLDVHLMLLQDEMLTTSGVKHWITDRLYNAEWALTTQLEVIGRQFDEMEDEYLRGAQGRPGAGGRTHPAPHEGRGPSGGSAQSPRRKTQQDLMLDDTMDVPLVLVAHDPSPADMLQFKACLPVSSPTWAARPRTPPSSRAAWTSRPWWARTGSQLVRQDDWVIIDGDAGVMIVDPSPIILAEYGFASARSSWSATPDAPAPHARSSIDGEPPSNCWPTSRCRRTPLPP